MTYPSVNTLFDSPAREDGSQKWVDFAESFWHVDCVRNIGLATFTERYRKWCKRHGYNFQSHKPQEIFISSKGLIAVFPKDDMTKTLIKQAIVQLNAVSQAVEHLRNDMNRLASELPEYPVLWQCTVWVNHLDLSLWLKSVTFHVFTDVKVLQPLPVLTPAPINQVHTKHRVCAPPSAVPRDFAKHCFKLWIAL